MTEKSDEEKFKELEHGKKEEIQAVPVEKTESEEYIDLTNYKPRNSQHGKRERDSAQVVNRLGDGKATRSMHDKDVDDGRMAVGRQLSSNGDNSALPSPVRKYKKWEKNDGNVPPKEKKPKNPKVIFAIFIITYLLIGTVFGVWYMIEYSKKNTVVNVDVPPSQTVVNNQYQNNFPINNTVNVHVDMSEEFLKALLKELNLTNSSG